MVPKLKLDKYQWARKWATYMRSLMPHEGTKPPPSEKAPADIVVRINADPTWQTRKHYFDSWLHHGSWKAVKAEERMAEELNGMSDL